LAKCLAGAGHNAGDQNRAKQFSPHFLPSPYADH
jgi:hypothetical protein